ncbi:hypothetical protein K469DRAFT_332994 [Zopfia rhizophila CBS 207.26]|uniref:Uncharacterized protein n=1 Tax=Zopfia rhizophila CBS 207.26 TaxID=1314779 RepID=A0A6A6DKJ0_9PEZI|nr:hypothetical protein K469DRAFT_332994 [Zopfia rhizophila CBS 207.26]
MSLERWDEIRGMVRACFSLASPVQLAERAEQAEGQQTTTAPRSLIAGMPQSASSTTSRHPSCAVPLVSLNSKP